MEPNYNDKPIPNSPISNATETPTNTKFCKFCGSKIFTEAIVCTSCGRQIEELKPSSSQQPIIINNANTNTNNNNNNNNNNNINSAFYGKPKDKIVALLLCFFLGWLGAHKFYEGKIIMGIIYLFTCGLCGIGIIVDLIVLILKPNPYYV